MTVAGPVAADDVWREQSQRVFESADVQSVRVSNARGRIEVRRSRDGQVHLTVLKTARSHSRQAAKDMARATQVALDTHNRELVVNVRYPQRMSVNIDFWDLLSGATTPKLEVLVAIEVPGAQPVLLTSTSGDLTTEDLSGPQTLRTTSGDVTVRGASGRLTAQTTSGDVLARGIAAAQLSTVSGDVTVEDVRGALRATTTSGDLEVRGASDSLDVRTVSGDLEVDEAPRGLTAETTSGDIQIEKASGSIDVGAASGGVSVGLAGRVAASRLSSSSGDVEIQVGRDVAASFDMHTSSGTIDCRLPVEVRRMDRRQVLAVLRSGATPIRVQTASGDITLAGQGD
jgi:DUF4097 and DUF4098 domain-containing protein YvlB